MAQVTVPQSEAFINYSIEATPDNGPFSIPYPFFATSDIKVSTISAAGVVTPLSGFTVTGTAVDDGYSSGSVTLAANVGPNVTVVVARQTPVEKLSNWPTSGAFSIYAENTLWSKHTAWHQQHFRDVARSIRAPMGEKLNDMPAKAIRASKMLVFDSLGHPKASILDADTVMADIEAAAQRAETAAANAEASEDAALASRNAAQASASNAASSASAALASQNAASTSASNAATSAAQAAASASNASGFATTAQNAATTATTQAGTATTKASEAASSASAAATSATNAANSATAAQVSADEAEYWADQAASLTAPDATETAKGVAEIATQAETNAGALGLFFVTPEKLRGFAGTLQGPVSLLGDLAIDKAASADKQIVWRSGGLDRWSLLSAANSDDLFVRRFDGTTLLGTALKIERGNGTVWLANDSLTHSWRFDVNANLIGESAAAFQPQIRMFNQGADTNGPYVILGKKRGASANTVANDTLGLLLWQSYWSAAWQNAAYIGSQLKVVGASPSAGFNFATVQAGALATRMSLDAGMQIGQPTGGDKGHGHLNIQNDIYLNGNLFTSADGSSLWVGPVASAISHIVMNSPIAHAAGQIHWRRNGLERWIIYCSVDESSGNAGSDIFFRRFTDAGAAIGNCADISRASGQWSFYEPTNFLKGIVVEGSGENYFKPSPITTGVAGLKVGYARTGSGASYMDFISDTTYTSFGTRFIRNSGPNGTLMIQQRGTGEAYIQTLDSAPITFYNGGTLDMRCDLGVQIGSPTGAVKGVGTLNIASHYHINGAIVIHSNGNPVARYYASLAARPAPSTAAGMLITVADSRQFQISNGTQWLGFTGTVVA